MNAGFEIAEGIGRIVLESAADPTNAWARPDFLAVADLQAFLERPELRAIVLSGAGRHFSSGADPRALAEAAGDSATLGAALSRGKASLEALSRARVPVVAAIRGSCLGAGLELAMTCHIRIAATGSMFGFPEATLGLLPGLGGTAPLGLAIERRRLLELVLSGRMIDAEEALALGLVDRVVTTARLESESLGYIEALTRDRSVEQIHAIVECVDNALRLPREAALRRETELFCELAARAARVRTLSPREKR